MAINTFVVRRWAALAIAGVLPTVSTVIGFVFYDIWVAVGLFVGALLISILMATLMLRTPFSMIQEGRGILCLNMDSTGVIMPFVMKVQSPYMRARVNGQDVRDVFDREAVYHLAVPKKAEMIAEGTPTGGIKIELTEEELNKGRFALFHYPVILYNGQLRTVITKDWFSEKEKTAFAEHGLLYMNRITEELTSYTRDFGRYVVEMLKPSSGGMGKWWWIILIGGIILLAAIFLPSIIDTIQGSGGGAVAAVTGSTATITPMG